MRRLGVALVLLGLSCGPDNGLSGSLSEIFPLDVSRTELARNGEALQVTYYRNRGVFLDVVARVSVSLRDVEVKPGVKIDLRGEYAPGSPRCVVTHAPGGEPVRSLPHVQQGDLVITEGGEAEQRTRGHFSMSFASDGGDLGFGRSLSGTFLGDMADAGFGELP